jgi:quercetin dioxygenase-like cupin family protein
MNRSLACAVLLLVSPVRADEPYRAVEEVLSATETIVGEPLRFPEGGSPNLHAVVITLRPGEATARHRHGVPLFAYILDGELTVDYAGHGKRVYRKGEAVLESMNVSHVGQNTGSFPVRILAVFLGAAGKPETIVEPAAAR